MRIVYLGTPEFSVLPLKKIIENGFNVVAVVTNVDKPIGRKQILTPPPVKQFAEELNIPVYQYNRIRLEGVEDLKQLSPDLMITCAFGQILSQEILDVPKYGVYNIHGSLLPKYRGASPIQSSILEGETETGITIMKTDAGVDTGDIVLQKSIKICNEDTSGVLFDKLSVLGAECIVEFLQSFLKTNKIELIKQDDSLATHTKIFNKEDAKINWSNDAKKIFDQIRAFNPSPVAYTIFRGEPLKIYKAKVVQGNGMPGEVVESKDQLIIACGKDCLSIEVLKKAGSNKMPVCDFLRGVKIEKGTLIDG